MSKKYIVLQKNEKLIDLIFKKLNFQKQIRIIHSNYAENEKYFTTCNIYCTIFHFLAYFLQSIS